VLSSWRQRTPPVPQARVTVWQATWQVGAVLGPVDGVTQAREAARRAFGESVGHGSSDARVEAGRLMAGV